MADPKYGALNAGGNRLIWNEKAVKSITDTAEAQKNIGGVENAAIGLNQAYGGLGKVFDQQQNAGVTGMRQMAGQQFAAMAGRGGASNAMASAGVGAANAQMAGQMGTFMSDMAAQRAQAAIAGAQSQYGAQKDLYDYRQTAASADLDAAQTFESMKIYDNMAEDFKKSLEYKAQEFLFDQDMPGLDSWVKSFQNPVERRAAWIAANKMWNAITPGPENVKLSIGNWEDYA